jgi:hypothetical protein
MGRMMERNRKKGTTMNRLRNKITLGQRKEESEEESEEEQEKRSYQG